MKKKMISFLLFFVTICFFFDFQEFNQPGDESNKLNKNLELRLIN